MIILVLGGTRSGKSAVAERIVSQFGSDVTYLATAVIDPTDSDFINRVDAHRTRRSDGWRTVECGADLVEHLQSVDGPVLVDSLGSWVTAHHNFEIDANSLTETLVSRAHPTILVSEEVGLGVHAPTDVARCFTDTLGCLNEQVALIADRVLLVIAGRALELPREVQLDR